MADDSDLYSMLMGDEPTAQEKALAMAQALRGQRRQADVQQQYGLLGQLSGDKVLGGVGQSLLGAASNGYGHIQAGQQLLAQVGEKRLQRGVESERNKALAQYHQDLLDEKNRAEAAKEEGIGGYGKGYDTVQTPDGLTLQRNNLTGDLTPVHAATSKLGGRGAGASTGGTGASGDDDEAMVERAAKDYNSGAGLPPLGAGKEAAALRHRILVRAAKLGGGTGVAGATADYKANSGSLHHFQTQADTIEAFEKTFTANAKPLEDAIADLQRTGHPGLNRPLNWLSQQSGDPKIAKFNAALQTFRSEAAKINSGQTGAGGTPISVMEEMAHVLPPDASPEQLLATIALLKQDAGNRKTAIAAQREEIRGRIAPARSEVGDMRSRASARVKELIASGVTDKAAIRKQLESEGIRL
jgi:hypothetical protein